MTGRREISEGNSTDIASRDDMADADADAGVESSWRAKCRLHSFPKCRSSRTRTVREREQDAVMIGLGKIGS